MNNIEQYMDFLENKLDSIDEQKFAETLAIDSDFRNDFKKYMYLKKALSASSKFYTPSSELKNAVFSNLGYTVGVTDIPAITPKKIGFFRSKLFAMIATGVTTFFLTALLFQLFDKNEDLNQIKTNDSMISSKSINKNETIKPSQVKSKQIAKQQALKPRPKLLAMNNDVKSNKTLLPEDIKPEKIELSPAYNNNENLLVMAQKKNSNDLNEFLIPENHKLLDTIFFIRSYDSKIRFEFKNTPSWFESTPTINPVEFNKINNLSVSLFYPIYKTFLLGAEFRQETFYVVYDGKDSKGKNATFYQQPNLSTLGFSLRYSPFDIGNSIKPFAQIFVGGNIAGIISREMLGFEYYPFDNVYFLFGADYNQFLFTHDNNWFTANKYSLNYGIGVKF
jgi:hypothetical protein